MNGISFLWSDTGIFFLAVTVGSYFCRTTHSRVSEILNTTGTFVLQVLRIHTYCTVQRVLF